MIEPHYNSPFSQAERKFDAGQPLTAEEMATLVNGYRGEISIMSDKLMLQHELRRAFESECG